MARAEHASTADSWLVFALSCAAVGVLLWLGHVGWDRWAPNAQIAEGRYFCEALRDGAVRQPANTWSNLAFIAVAVAIARSLGREQRQTALIEDRVVARLYVALVAQLGLGSMCLHASLTRWGGVADVSSMIVFVAFVAAYSVASLARLSRRGCLALYAAIAVAAEALYLVIPALGIAIFGALVVAFAGAELARARRTPQRRTRWLVAAAACFGAALAIWIPSQNGGAWCAPHSLLQGHAVWHVLCAAAAGCLFLYFRSGLYPNQLADQ